MITRCVIYIRVNVGVERDDAFRSVQTQLAACHAFIDSRRSQGWTCMTIYEDIGHSGGTLDRPALQRLLAEMKDQNFDCVVLYSLDRLTRSHDDHDALMAEFRQHDVSLATVSPPKVRRVPGPIGSK